MRLAVATLLLCACGAQVGGNIDDNGPDAPSNGGEAPPPIDAPSCKRVVYLSFEGETLTDTTASDAKQNLASWMTIGSGAAPQYKAGAGDRLAQIQVIVDGVRNQLSSFPIQVVTTRPTDGDYMMIVYGGQAQQVGSRFGGAVQELDCDDATSRNDLAWVADIVTPPQRVINFSIGAIGFGLGLTATLDPVGCMCGWDNNCNQLNTPCVLSTDITRDPAARQRCANAPPQQNEVQTFAQGFCL